MKIELLRQQVREAAYHAVNVRRDLHRFPEAGNEEYRTAEIIEAELKELGLYAKRMLPTGIVSTIESGCPEKETGGIGLRADIDGLPVEEGHKLPFSSLIDGYMHACGHDVHTSIILGTARVLIKNRDRLRRDVRLIFQPAEETVGGAEKMIAAGCMKNPIISEIYGLHIMPELTSGQIGIRYGCVHAASDMFRILIKGRASHGASPEMGVDALLTACQIVESLQTVVSRSVAPTEPAVLSIGSFHSGSAGNVVAEEAVLEGIIRSMGPETADLMKRRSGEIVSLISAAAGAEGAVKFTKGYSALINDNASVRRLKEIASGLIGEDNCIIIKNASMRAEDFSCFLEKAGGCYFFLGSGFPNRFNPPIHSGDLYVDEKCVETGILIMSGLCLL
ncbi:M20 family metallopeptidase [Bacillota bacterium]